jgi:isopentenyl-diphosphate delta-isomerase
VEQVVLVDDAGNEVGTMDKEAAHQAPGHLHLAFSVFLRSPSGQLLIQRRALEKYHFPGAWANACCSHPRPGEALADAARRRVAEELGLDSEPSEIGTFTYRATDPASGLVEHELDHIFTATVSADPEPDPSEVMEWRWIGPDELRARVNAADPTLAPWVSAAVHSFPELGG